jgi:hypothetical protein
MFPCMMDRREALLLVERLKRRTRDPDVLALCEYVHGTDVHGTILNVFCRRAGIAATSSKFETQRNMHLRQGTQFFDC